MNEGSVGRRVVIRQQHEPWLGFFLPTRIPDRKPALPWTSQRLKLSPRHASGEVSAHPATLPIKVLQVELTIEPPGVVLICAHGCLLSKCAENGCIGAHKIDVDSCIELLICRSIGASVRLGPQVESWLLFKLTDDCSDSATLG